MRRKFILGAAALIAALFSNAALAQTVTVGIANFTFTPAELTVTRGTTVVFNNDDDIPHLVVASDGSFRSKALDTGDSFSFNFAKAGEYGYFCALHPHMVGKIVVKP
jgi:plastocyanin